MEPRSQYTRFFVIQAAAAVVLVASAFLPLIEVTGRCTSDCSRTIVDFYGRVDWGKSVEFAILLAGQIAVVALIAYRLYQARQQGRSPAPPSTGRVAVWLTLAGFAAALFGSAFLFVVFTDVASDLKESGVGQSSGMWLSLAASATSGGISGASTSQSRVWRATTPSRAMATPPITTASRLSPRFARKRSKRAMVCLGFMGISLYDT